MSQNTTRYAEKARVNPVRVFFTGTGALQKGIGVCYDSDRGTATETDESRMTYVELPTITNNNRFAGVTARAYTANSAGQFIEIYEPGSVCDIAVMADTVVDTTLLTCKVGVGGQGRFEAGKFRGRGSALALQTNASGVGAAESDGTGYLGTTGLVLTGTGFTAGASVGDTVIIYAGEDDDTNLYTAGDYTIASVDSNTQVTLSSAASDGGTMLVNYRVISGNPTALVLLLGGEESGLVEWVSPDSPGTAMPNDPMPGGVTNIFGGQTLAATDSTTGLADGLFLGQGKYFECHGEIGGNNYVVTPDTASIGGVSHSDTDAALTSLAFDGDGDLAFLEWNGTMWVPAYFTGAALA